ncbi:putative transcriptional regulatory protein [uncultured Pleomorphomonas sp.]|uniref:Putative transcriptional regulatory protein n=2 Tax=uncultured Pleomorphomonas sp. TaxID=442121 RepID=A0A212LL42_9HYPH|nr:putative transcriptional regulatory protein [uncultured Pleomorphomonas sp.]
MSETESMTSFRPTQPSPGISTAGRLARLAGALGVAALLAACQADEIGYGYGPKDQRPVSPKTLEAMKKLNMKLSSPVLMRIFKEENKFEVWKMNASGRYALLKSYDICRWSGNLGPKVKEGDRQAPEGFYPITPGLMNPKSDWYLAFNTGFPNAYDRANGRTGTALMVHGSCSSRGCYAMTDPQIQEIYALAREAFRGGQKAFQLQAFPFRLDGKNMAKHWHDPNMPFWKMLKEGYDTFEMTHQEPKVDVCGRKYVFNANPAEPLDTVAACPVDLGQPKELVASLQTRAKADYAEAEVMFAKLENDRKAEEDKRIQLALAAEKRKADAEKAKAEAELARIEAERNPSTIARLFGAEPNPDAGITIGPVIVPPTGAPVPIADPRGPQIHAVALAEPVEQERASAISRLFSFVTGGDKAPAAAPIIPVAATAPALPTPATPALVPAIPAQGAPVAAAPAATAVPAITAAAPIPPLPGQPAPAVTGQPGAVAQPAGPQIACATPGVVVPAGTPPCPSLAAAPAVDPAPTARDKSILDRIGSWF